jgi:hypothetical protein
LIPWGEDIRQLQWSQHSNSEFPQIILLSDAAKKRGDVRHEKHKILGFSAIDKAGGFHVPGILEAAIMKKEIIWKKTGELVCVRRGRTRRIIP